MMVVFTATIGANAGDNALFSQYDASLSIAQNTLFGTAEMVDPYPLMTVQYAVAALRARFGCECVMCESHEITLRLQQQGRKGFTLLVLTAEQAKYLVARPLSVEDLTNETYPEDWPQSLEGVKRLPPSRPVHGETLPVAFSPHSDLTMPSGSRAAMGDWPANPSSTPSEKLQ
jgi:hypothetical protein